MTLEGGNDGANASVTIQLRKETTVKQILEDAAGQLGMGHEFSKNLCLVYPPDADIANAGEKIGVELTVEQANLFNHRPRLCKLNVITDEYVNRLVEKLKKHKRDRKEKDEPDFDPEVEDLMDKFEDKASDKIKTVAIVKSQKGDPVGNLQGNVEFESVLATMTIEKAKLRQ